MVNRRIEPGTIVVATYGFNNITKQPFKFLYDFGYYTINGCVVYNHGEKNMQDSHAFKFDQVEVATVNDIAKYFWGM